MAYGSKKLLPKENDYSIKERNVCHCVWHQEVPEILVWYRLCAANGSRTSVLHTEGQDTEWQNNRISLELKPSKAQTTFAWTI